MPDRKPVVFIAWMDEGCKHFSYLAYNDGKGPIRTYYKDKYDCRLRLGDSEDLPYFSDYLEALTWMMANPEQQCQIDVTLRSNFHLKKRELSEEVAC